MGKTQSGGAGFEDGEGGNRSCGMWAAPHSEKGKETILPQSLWKEYTVTLAQ